MSSSANNNSRDDDASRVGNEIRRQRTEKLEALRSFPTNRDAFRLSNSPFYQEMAFFVPFALVRKSSQTLSIRMSTEEEAEARRALALLMRVMSHQFAGSPSGRASEFGLGSYSYMDTASSKPTPRMKVNIFAQWMVRNTALVDGATGSAALSPENVVGILFRAISVDPLYDFDDALDYVLRENTMAQVNSALRNSITKKRDQIFHRITDIERAADDCKTMRLGQKLFRVMMYPDRFDAEIGEIVADVIKEAIDEKTSAFLASRREEERAKAEVQDSCRTKAAAAVKNSPPPEDKLHELLGMRSADNSSKVADLRNFFLLQESQYVHTVAARAAVANSGAGGTEEEAEAYALLSSTGTEISALSLSDYVTAISFFGAECNEQELAEVSGHLQQMQARGFSGVMRLPACISTTKCFTLKNALQRARARGADADQCTPEHYYDAKFKPYSSEFHFEKGTGRRSDTLPLSLELRIPDYQTKDPNHANEVRKEMIQVEVTERVVSRPVVANANAAMQTDDGYQDVADSPVQAAMEEAVELVHSEIERANDLLLAPFRACHYMKGLYSMSFSMPEFSLSNLEKMQFPWTATDLPKRLDDAFARLLQPGPDCQTKIISVVSQLRKYLEQNKNNYTDEDGIFNGLRRDIASIVNAHSDQISRAVPGTDIAADLRNTELPAGVDEDADESECFVDIDEDAPSSSAPVVGTPVPVNNADSAPPPPEKELTFTDQVIRAKRLRALVDAPGARRRAGFKNLYQQLLNSKMIRPNTEQLRDDLRALFIKLQVIRKLAPDEYRKLVPDFRMHCIMEFSRVYSSCAMNNGDSLIALYAWQESQTAMPQYNCSRLVSHCLSLFGNSMADAVRSSSGQLGIKVNEEILAMQLVTRSNIFDLEATRLNRLSAGPTSSGKSFAGGLLIDCSIRNTIKRVNSASRQAGNDMSVQGLCAEYCEEASNVINTGTAKDSRDMDMLNDLRNKLAEGMVCKIMSVKGQYTQHIMVSAPRCFYFGTNYLRPNWKEASLYFRLMVDRYRQISVRSNGNGRSLLATQLSTSAITNESAIVNQSAKLMWQHEQLVTSLLLHASNTFGLPQPCILLLACIVPAIMRIIGGLIPNSSQYIRHSARAHSTCRSFAAHTAWYAKYCTPLGAGDTSDTSDSSSSSSSSAQAGASTAFDVMDLRECSRYATATLETCMWSFFIMLEEIMPWHATPVLHAAAYRFAKFNPASMNHLFAFKDIDTGHPAPHDNDVTRQNAFQTKYDPIKKTVQIYTFGTQPSDFSRKSTAEMPDFWRDEERILEGIGKSQTDEWGQKDLCAQTSFAQTYSGLTDPNFLEIEYGNQTRLTDSIYEVLERDYSLEREWIVEIMEMFRYNCMLRLPKLRCGLAKNDVLSWQTVKMFAPGTDKVVGEQVVVEEIRIFSQDFVHNKLRLSTVFLWLFQHRYLRMNALAATEDHFTKTGSRWILPFPVNRESGLLQVFVRRQQKNRYLCLDNPFYNPSGGTGSDTLSAQWIGNMMQQHVSELIRAQTNNSLALFGAHQVSVQTAHTLISKAQQTRQEGYTKICRSVSTGSELEFGSAFAAASSADKRIIFRFCSPEDDAFIFHWADEISLDDISKYVPSRVERRLTRMIQIMSEIEDQRATQFDTQDDAFYPMRAVAQQQYPEDFCTHAIVSQNPQLAHSIALHTAAVLEAAGQDPDSAPGADTERSSRGEKRSLELTDEEKNAQYELDRVLHLQALSRKKQNSTDNDNPREIILPDSLQLGVTVDDDDDDDIYTGQISAEPTYVASLHSDAPANW